VKDVSRESSLERRETQTPGRIEAGALKDATERESRKGERLDINEVQ
jgi:hypothetical protein